MPLKEFVIFRHAQKSSWSNDPDLSQEGHRQALQITNHVSRRHLPTPQQLISSPKKRAQQTLIPLQEQLQIPLLIEPILDERSTNETGQEFENRVKSFLQDALPQKNHSCLYLCTHLDWLEVFSWAAPLVDDISSEILHLPPAHFYHVAISNERNQPWQLLKKGGIS